MCFMTSQLIEKPIKQDFEDYTDKVHACLLESKYTLCGLEVESEAKEVDGEWSVTCPECKIKMGSNWRFVNGGSNYVR